MILRFTPWFLLALFVTGTALTACGGGDDEIPETVGKRTVCPPLAEHLSAINAGRAHRAPCGPAARPLSVHATLQHVAQQHAEYLSIVQPDLHGQAASMHQDSKGRRVQGRLADAKHPRFAEEVLGAGYETADDVMAAYRESPPHCPWVMWLEAAEIGLGCAVAGDGRAYWVHVLGLKR
jgi:uncharacterized protein YkwD